MTLAVEPGATLFGEVRIGPEAMAEIFDQARASDRVLCLNRVQIAFGPPVAALTAEVIERTYGGEIVALGDGPDVLLPAHHHHGPQARP